MTNTFAFKTTEGRNAVFKAYDAFLGNMRIPHEEVHVDTRFGKAFAIAAGEKGARVLALLHGSGMNSVMWIEDMVRYSGHYRVYAFDLQGEPGKSDGRQLPFEGPDFEKWLYDVFAGLSIEKASLIGISLGAWLALKFAIAPSRDGRKAGSDVPRRRGSAEVVVCLRILFYMLAGERAWSGSIERSTAERTCRGRCWSIRNAFGKHSIPPGANPAVPGRGTCETAHAFAGIRRTQTTSCSHSLKTAERLRKARAQRQSHRSAGRSHALTGLADDILGVPETVIGRGAI